jgi:hypothetical protein
MTLSFTNLAYSYTMEETKKCPLHPLLKNLNKKVLQMPFHPTDPPLIDVVSVGYRCLS